MADTSASQTGPAASGGGYRPYSHGHFRNRRHRSAHAGADDAPALPTVEHPLVSSAAPTFVQEQPQVDALIEQLRAAGRFAYDSEFIGERTYVPQLCLIQVATAQGVWLIDTLVGLDLTRFWQLLCDAAVHKIVHAGDQDIEPVHRNAGCAAQNVFDTQIGAGLIGLAYPVALAKLVREVIGVRLEKGHTVTDWQQRPLSAMQLRYAADDVRYLLAVHEFVAAELASRGHTAWADAECRVMCDPSQYGFNAATATMRIRGSATLAPRNAAVLRALAIWRDQLAREHNVPARTFLRDEVLLDLARAPVKSREKLGRVRGMPRPLEESYGDELLGVIATALNHPATEAGPAAESEPTPRQRFLADAFWSALQCHCAGRGIDPALVTSAKEVAEFFHSLNSGKPVDHISLLQGWRREAVGQAMLELLAGERTFTVQWADTLVVESVS